MFVAVGVPSAFSYAFLSLVYLSGHWLYSEAWGPVGYVLLGQDPERVVLMCPNWDAFERPLLLDG